MVFAHTVEYVPKKYWHATTTTILKYGRRSCQRVWHVHPAGSCCLVCPHFSARFSVCRRDKRVITTRQELPLLSHPPASDVMVLNPSARPARSLLKDWTAVTRMFQDSNQRGQNQRW